MLDTDVLKLLIPGIALLLLIFILSARGFGVIKLKYLNFKELCELKKLRLGADGSLNSKALAAIINHCQVLNSKWVLEESDLDILSNTYQLIKKIACSYHPDSKHPVEEARIRWVLNAFMELKNHLLVITTWKGIHAATQFRIRHIVILSHAWRLKRSWKESKVFIFLDKHGLFPLFKWFFFIIRCVDLACWTTKMIVYVIQDIIFKVFLVRWYLIIGKLASQVYSDRGKDPNTQPETILEDLNSMPECENYQIKNLPEQIKKVSEFSRNEILYHTWSVEWTKVKGIYINLVKDIAHKYNPQSEQPIYEAKLSELLTSGAHFSEQIATIQTYPFLNKILHLRIKHALIAKDATEFLANNQVLSWVKKHKLTYIFKYSLLLFKAVEKKHPALLFKDFAFTLAGEGCKRWFYLYLHDRITLETEILYRKSQATPTDVNRPPSPISKPPSQI